MKWNAYFCEVYAVLKISGVNELPGVNWYSSVCALFGFVICGWDAKRRRMGGSELSLFSRVFLIGRETRMRVVRVVSCETD